MQELREVQRLITASNFNAAQAELNALRTVRLERQHSIEDVEQLQLDLDKSRQKVIADLISQAETMAAADQWEQVLSLVDQIFELQPGEQSALRLHQTANEAMRRIAKTRAREATIADARRRVENIRSRQDAVMAIAFIDADVANANNAELQALLALARQREEEIRKRENKLSTLEQMNDMVTLLGELEQEYQRGVINITINGQVRELASYMPQVRSMVRTSSEAKADQYLERARQLQSVSPQRALAMLEEAQKFPQMTVRKIDQIGDEIKSLRDLVTQWEHAQDLMNDAICQSTADPITALSMLAQARALAPNLPGLSDEMVRLRRDVVSANLQRLRRQIDDYRLQVEAVRQESDYAQTEATWKMIAELYDATVVIWDQVDADPERSASPLVDALRSRFSDLRQEYGTALTLRRAARLTLDAVGQAWQQMESNRLEAAERHLAAARETGVLVRAVSQLEDLIAERKGADETYRRAVQSKDDGDYVRALELIDKLPPSAERDHLRRMVFIARTFEEAEIAFSANDLSAARKKFEEVLRYESEHRQRAQERVAEILNAQRNDEAIATRLANARLDLDRKRYQSAIDEFDALLRQPSNYHAEIRDAYRQALAAWHVVLIGQLGLGLRERTTAALAAANEAADHLEAYQIVETPGEREQIEQVRHSYFLQQAQDAEQRYDWRHAHAMWVKLVQYDPQAAQRAQIADQHAIVREAANQASPLEFLRKHSNDSLYRHSPIIVRALIEYCLREHRLSDAQAYVEQLQGLSVADAEVVEIRQRVSRERIYQAEYSDVERQYRERRYFEAIRALEKLMEHYPERKIILEPLLVEWRNQAIIDLERQAQSGTALSRYLACRQIEQFGRENSELAQRKLQLYTEARSDLEDVLQRTAKQLNYLNHADLKEAQQALGDARFAFSNDRDLVARTEEALRLVVQRINDHDTLSRLLDEVRRLIGQGRIEEAHTAMVSRVEERYQGRSAVAQLREELNVLRKRREDQLRIVTALRPAMQQERFDEAVQLFDQLHSHARMLLTEDDYQGLLPWRDPKSRQTYQNLTDLENCWLLKRENHDVVRKLQQDIRAELARFTHHYTLLIERIRAPSADTAALLDTLKQEVASAVKRWQEASQTLPAAASSSADTLQGDIEEVLETQFPQLRQQIARLIERFQHRDQRILDLDQQIELRINARLFDEQTRQLIQEALELDSARSSFLWYERVFQEQTRPLVQKRRWGLF